MQRSKTEIYLHFVWATHRRLPLITPALEVELYQVLTDQAQSLECQVLALGGVSDHVHLVVSMPSKHAPFEIAKQLKGASSAWVRQHIRPNQPISAEPFGWQDNYACFSLSRTHLKQAIYYVTHQKQHHAEQKLWPDWEETHQEVPTLSS
jgi:putative transposase